MADSTQNKPKREDLERKDEYLGKYRDEAAEAPADQKFWGAQNPVRNDPPPFKNTTSAGG